MMLFLRSRQNPYLLRALVFGNYVTSSTGLRQCGPQVKYTLTSEQMLNHIFCEHPYE